MTYFIVVIPVLLFLIGGVVIGNMHQRQIKAAVDWNGEGKQVPHFGLDLKEALNTNSIISALCLILCLGFLTIDSCYNRPVIKSLEPSHETLKKGEKKAATDIINAIEERYKVDG